MKKLLTGGLVLASFFLAGGVFAGEHHKSTYKNVQQVSDLDFSVERDGKKLDFSWDSYDGNDFKWYKIVYSKTNVSPSYPEDTVIRYVPHQKTESFALSHHTAVKGGYYRLCVITQSNGRKCSNVVLLSALDRASHGSKKHKQTTAIDAATKKKVDLAMGSFFAKVEQKYAGNDRIKVLRAVSVKLSSIAQKKPELAPVVQLINERIARKIKEYGVDINDVTKILQDI